MRRAAAWIVLVGWIALAGGAQAGAVVVINEVLADPAGDANGDGVVSATQDEFVELLNTDAASVSLKGWKLKDALSVRHVFADGDVMGPGGFFVVFGSSASSGTLSLNNVNETVTLLDFDGHIVDALTYGTEGGKDVSLARQPDGTGAFVLYSKINDQSFSPGRTIDGLSNWPLPAPPEPDPLPEPDPVPPPIFDPPVEELPDASVPPVVPEPSSWLLLGSGLSFIWRRRFRAL